MSGDQLNLRVEGHHTPALDTNVTTASSSIVAEKFQATFAAARGNDNDPDPRPDAQNAKAAPRV